MSKVMDSSHSTTSDRKYRVLFCPHYHRKVLVDPIDVRLKVLFLKKAADI
jgi:putative transposase